MSSISPLATGVVRLTVAVVLLGSAACASNPNSASPAQGGQRGDRYVITSGELENAGANNLFDAITKLRPDYFRQRGNDMGAQTPIQSSRGDGGGAPTDAATTGKAVQRANVPIKVYQNDQLMTGVDDLRQISVSQVIEVRYIPGPQAVVRYGTNHSSGAILVRTRG
jgi:hypothetical protein